MPNLTETELASEIWDICIDGWEDDTQATIDINALIVEKLIAYRDAEIAKFKEQFATLE